MTTHAPDDAKPATAARIYDYMLGGTHNFPADREAARQVVEVWPLAPALARNNRAFLRRAVRMLTEAGIGQFLDLGSGIPTAGNVHELAPAARVVYVDIDPVAVAESQEILDDQDRVTALRADLTQPETVLEHPEVRRLLSFDEPIAILSVAVLHFVADDALAYPAIERYLAATAPGSYLAISHGSVPEEADLGDLPETAENVYQARTATPVAGRSRSGVARFFAGMEMVEPGLVWLPQWRPAPDDPADFTDNPADCLILAGVGRKL